MAKLFLRCQQQQQQHDYFAQSCSAFGLVMKRQNSCPPQCSVLRCSVIKYPCAKCQCNGILLHATDQLLPNAWLAAWCVQLHCAEIYAVLVLLRLPPILGHCRAGLPCLPFKLSGGGNAISFGYLSFSLLVLATRTLHFQLCTRKLQLIYIRNMNALCRVSMET